MNKWIKSFKLLRFMLLEEYRLHKSMIGKFQFLFFPILIAIFAFVISISSSVLLLTMSTHQIYFILHSTMLVYGLGVGGFALFGEHIAERRFGQINLLLTTPTTHPIGFKNMFLIFYIKDIIYYLLFSIVPIIVGIGLSIPITAFKITSVLFLFLTITLSFLLGISFSFFLSSIYVRWRVIFIILIGAVALAIVGSFITGLHYIEQLIPPLMFQYTMSPVYLSITIVLILTFSTIAVNLIKIQFGKKSRQYPAAIIQTKEKFRFTRKYSTYFAKEWLDIKRSKMLYPFMSAYIGPLIFIALIQWFLKAVLIFPISFNIIFYAALIGFFGVTIYGWLNITDTPDFYQVLPVTVSQLIKTKLLLLALFTSTISTVFLVILSILNSELHLLWLALIITFITTSYTVLVTAYLTGLRTNTYLFDPIILAKFAVMVIPPLIIIAIASFILSDYFIISGSLIGCLCVILVLSVVLLYRGIEKRWNKAAFRI